MFDAGLLLDCVTVPKLCPVARELLRHLIRFGCFFFLGDPHSWWQVCDLIMQHNL